MKRFPPAVRRFLIAAGICLLVVSMRVCIESATDLKRGEGYLDAGDRQAAVFYFRSAARWYFPFAPWPVAALDELMQLGETAEAEGDFVFALHAFDSARSAILGSRSFYTPHHDRLERIEERLPMVMARAREVHPNGPNTKPEQRDELIQRFRADIAVDHSPNPVWSVVSTLGFVLWLVGFALAAWRGFLPSGGMDRPQLLRFSGLGTLGFALWITGLACL